MNFIVVVGTKLLLGLPFLIVGVTPTVTPEVTPSYPKVVVFYLNPFDN